ncbi:MAG: phosphatidate cytidylyltransferase [Actinobacteria bacterium]|nr:MAG: phosphatidate cytidylyltransferase [Actinomycetota bacterium]
MPAPRSTSGRRPPPGPSGRARRSGRGGGPPRSRRAGRARRRNTRSDFWARVLSALPAIGLAIFLVVEGGLVFTLGLIALGALCMHELFRMLDPEGPVRLAAFLGLAALLLAANYGSQFNVLLMAVAIVPVLFGLTLLQVRSGTVGMAITLLALWWIGLALAHAVLLRRLPHGSGVIVDVLVGTFLGDTGAYLGGRTFGRRPLAPRLSPSKTVEGLLFGMVASVLGVWLASTYQDWLPGGKALLLGLGVAVAAPVGDLFESYIKRDAGAKDTGRVFGAHGGALDRLDAVLFTAVTGYYIWNAMIG